jgi:cell division protein FtsL
MNKKKNRPQQLRHAGLWALLMGVFITELLVYTWFRVQCTQLGYEINRAAETQKRQTALQNSLKIEMARLKSPERIVKIATDKLGLVMPQPEQIMSLP